MGEGADILAVAAVLALPLVVAGASRLLGGRASREGFISNAGRNGFLATFAGAVAGNVGVGGFLAIFLFGTLSPVIAASVVGAYTLGLLLCALLASPIRARALSTGSIGLVDMVVAAHGGRALGVWLPVAVVFVLRSAVQVGALGAIVAAALPVAPGAAVLATTALLGLYLVLGGYRAAVETDVAQSLVLCAGVAVAAFGLSRLEGAPDPFLSFGPYAPTLLIGVWLFLPWSAVLAVDNWQRIVLARSTATARLAYLAAALACCAIFVVIALVGYRAPDGMDMRAAFAAAMPEGWAWLASAMLVACIMSSVDTFVMPLASSLGTRWTLGRLRLLIVGLLVATAVLAIGLGDVIATVIAAFNGLAVFLPAAFGTVFLTRPPPRGAALSMNAGLACALGFAFVDIQAAALVGFAGALVAYLAAMRLAAMRLAATRLAAKPAPGRPDAPSSK